MDGRRAERLETDLIRLEARADAAGVASLEAVSLNWGSRERGQPVDYVHFQQAAIDFGKRLSIAFEVTGQLQTVFDGLITGIGAAYPELRPPELTLLAEDALAGLRYRRRTRLSENLADGDIASTILGDAGLRADVGRSGASHVELWQVNEDDLGALRARSGDALIELREHQFLPTREREISNFNVNKRDITTGYPPPLQGTFGDSPNTTPSKSRMRLLYTSCSCSASILPPPRKMTARTPTPCATDSCRPDPRSVRLRTPEIPR